jgi:hypothetical protein
LKITNQQAKALKAWAESQKLKYSTDFYAFVREVLQNDKVGEVHKELIEFIDTSFKAGKKQVLVQMPRNTFKSTTLAISYPLWLATNDPNIRICLMAETYALSCKYLMAIKTIIERNSRYQAIYGTMGGDKVSQKWTESEIILKGRTKEYLKEATITSMGIDSSMTGTHYDIIINTDLVSERNSKTVDMLNKTIEFYKTEWPLLDPVTGRMITEGTVYNESDLYGHIKENEAEITPMFHRQATVDGTLTGELVFKDILDHAFLKFQHLKIGSRGYEMQYNCNAVRRDNVPFGSSYAQFWESLPKNLYITLTVDPAISDDPDACDTAISVAGTDPIFNDLYELETVSGKMKPTAIVAEIFRLHQKWKPARTGIESAAMQNWVRYNVEQEMRKKNYWFNCEELKGWQEASKHERIMKINPRWENKAIYLKKGDNKLYNQFIRYREDTKKRLDVLDGFAYHLDIQKQYTVNHSKAIEDRGKNLTQSDRAVWEDFNKELKELAIARKNGYDDSDDVVWN